ncbi:hypothetical protein ACHAW5_002491 [Stephanodiscus triporus]|uniref:Uncharacterized protein n=1 Tax=Stephanodiscus triporus TaxID=2934178 RepID=A0ABD3R0C0_9STRA
MTDARLLQESSRLSQQRTQRSPPPTAKNTSPFGSPIKGGKLPSGHHDILSTFSTSSGSSSASSGWASNFQTSVVTEDHDFGRNDGGGLFVEEFLYDNDPVGLRQWKEQPRPIPPKDRHVNVAAADGGGWCAFGGSSSFDNTPSSLQLGRPRNWWSFTPRAFAAPLGRAKSFRGEDDRNDGVGSVSGFPLGFALGEKDSEDGDNDEEGGHHSSNKRKYTRRCKLTTLAISLVVAIGAVVLAVALLVHLPGENLTKPSPPHAQCVNLEIVVSASNQTDDVNAWSLNRIGEDDKAVTIDSSESIPEKSGDSYVYKSCVEPGSYTFDISDSSGNGLGRDGEGGYYITADGITLGISSFFFHDERMTFDLPFYAENANANDDHEDTACTDDFFLAVHTDGNPGETTWNVIDNDTGDEVLAGGPYSLPLAVYTQRACLPNGSYTFNMLDDGGDGVCCDNGKGFFLLSKDGKTIMNSNGEFGAESSTVFVLGDEDV